MISLQRTLVALSLGAALAGPALGQISRYDDLANLPLTEGYLSKQGRAVLKERRWATVFPGSATFTASPFTKMIAIEFAIMLTSAGKFAQVPSRWWDRRIRRRP
jgi:hypothetical protein